MSTITEDVIEALADAICECGKDIDDARPLGQDATPHVDKMIKLDGHRCGFRIGELVIHDTQDPGDKVLLDKKEAAILVHIIEMALAGGLFTTDASYRLMIKVYTAAGRQDLIPPEWREQACKSSD